MYGEPDVDVKDPTHVIRFSAEEFLAAGLILDQMTELKFTCSGKINVMVVDNEPDYRFPPKRMLTSSLNLPLPRRLLRSLVIATKEVVDSGVKPVWWHITREHDGKWMILGSANGMGFNLEPTTDCGLILHAALEIVDKAAGPDSKRKMLADLVGRKFVPRSAWMLDEKGDPIWWTGQVCQAATLWS